MTLRACDETFLRSKRSCQVDAGPFRAQKTRRDASFPPRLRGQRGARRFSDDKLPPSRFGPPMLKTHDRDVLFESPRARRSDPTLDDWPEARSPRFEVGRLTESHVFAKARRCSRVRDGKIVQRSPARNFVRPSKITLRNVGNECLSIRKKLPSRTFETRQNKNKPSKKKILHLRPETSSSSSLLLLSLTPVLSLPRLSTPSFSPSHRLKVFPRSRYLTSSHSFNKQTTWSAPSSLPRLSSRSRASSLPKRVTVASPARVRPPLMSMSDRRVSRSRVSASVGQNKQLSTRGLLTLSLSPRSPLPSRQRRQDLLAW